MKEGIQIIEQIARAGCHPGDFSSLVNLNLRFCRLPGLRRHSLSVLGFCDVWGEGKNINLL